MTFLASYSGYCQECGHRFGVGDPIKGDPREGYSHEACVRLADQPPAKVCDRCWLVIAPSGACGCEVDE